MAPHTSPSFIMSLERFPFNLCIIKHVVIGPIFSFVFLISTLPVWAGATNLNSNIPNAGSLQQQIERDREFNRSNFDLFKGVDQQAPSRVVAGPSLTVKEFKFVGNSIFTSELLSIAVSSYLNHTITFADLELASAAVANVYRQEGWVVKTLLPAQDILNGVVTIQVIESKFGKVIIEGDSLKRIPPSLITSIIYTVQPPGSALNSNNIDRGLMLVDDLPGLSAQGSFSEGSANGQTDLVITIIEKTFTKTDVTLDNTGSRSTGVNRIAASTALNSPAGLGDQLTFNLISSEGSEYLRLSETLPIGYGGFKMGFNASYLDYRLVSQDFSALAAFGTSSILGLEASYPLIKSRATALNAVLNVDQKRFVNNSQGAVVSDYKNTPISLNLNGFRADSWLGNGNSTVSWNVSGGSVNLSNSTAQYQSTDTSTTKVAGQYTKSRYFLSREQDLTSGFSLYSTVSGQWASKNLDSSEKFYLGGIDGVRAYPTNEAGGSLGQIANMELRSRFGSGYTLAGFYDFGRVLINPDNSFVGASALNAYALKGAGLALTYQSTKGAQIKATFARRIGANPNPASTGNDQDGSLAINRLWLNARLPF